MITGPPYELVYRYWPLYEDAFARFRTLMQLNPEGRVSSWFRSPAVNADVGGAPRSQHLMALAIDVVLEDAQVERFIETARWLGLTPVRERGHIHVQRYEAGTLPAYLFRGE